MFSRLATKLHSRLALLGEAGPLDRIFSRGRRPFGRAFLRRKGRLRDLEQLGRRAGDIASPSQVDGRPAPGSGRRTLIASLRAWPAHNAYESLLAHALRLRGVEVALLTCGGGQPLCELGWARHVWPLPCDRCGWYTDRVGRAARLPHYRLADGLPWGGDARRAPLEPVSAQGAPDPHRAAEISVPWMLKSTTVGDSPYGPDMQRDFAVSASGVAESAMRVLDEFRPDTVLLLGGLFTAERAIRETALDRGVRVVTYEIAPHENSLILSSGAPAAFFDVHAAWERARNKPLTPAQRSAAETLLAARAEGRGLAERYYDDPLADPDRVRAALELPEQGRVISLFTNLTWDSAVVGRHLAYDSMLSWLREAVEIAGELDEVALVVRVHPGEERWGTMEPASEALGDPPENVRVIEADQPLSSYALLALSDLALTYSTTVGLEAAAGGTPVAVAGDTHYRERGFTYDLRSPDDLGALLRSERWSIGTDQVELALRYAFLFFFKSLIPFPAVLVDDGYPRAVPDDPSALLPGADPYLDFVCDRILDGGEFVLPDDLALRYVPRTGKG